MRWFLRRVIVLLTALALVLVPCMTGFAQEPEQADDIVGGKMASELIVRPLGIVATVGGAAIFVLTLPFSALGGNTEAAHEYLVEDPFNFTFKRPLGDF